MDEGNWNAKSIPRFLKTFLPAVTTNLINCIPKVTNIEAGEKFS